MSDKLRQQAEKNKILEIRSGSYLYGTNTPESDEDFIGIFMPPMEYVYGLQSVQEIDLGIKDKNTDGKNTINAVDRKLYEFRKFVDLAQRNNPNIIEILFVNQDNVLFINDFGKKLLANKHLFPSKLAAKKFIGYAHSQRHKMIIKKDNFNVLREGYKILSECDDKITMAQVAEQGYGYFDQSESNSPIPLPIFTTKGNGYHIHVGDLAFEPGVYTKKARKIIKERLDKATNRSELILKHGFDTKFGSHLVRLLTEGVLLLKEGQLIFPLPNASTILDIKNGSMTAKEVIKYADDLEADLDKILEKSTLPATPPYNKIETLVIDMMREHLA